MSSRRLSSSRLREVGGGSGEGSVRGLRKEGEERKGIMATYRNKYCGGKLIKATLSSIHTNCYGNIIIGDGGHANEV